MRHNKRVWQPPLVDRADRRVGFKPDAADMPAVDLHLLPIDISSLSKIASHVMNLR
jgi:hypothetical protein